MGNGVLNQGTYTINPYGATLKQPTNYVINYINGTLTGRNPIVLIANGISPNCSGSTGTINFNATGGSGTISNKVNNVTATSPYTATSAGNYTIVAVDAVGCSDTAVVAISIPTVNVNVNIAANGPTTFLYGNSVTLSGPAVGNALSFNGTSNYLSLPPNINTNFSGNNISVEGWFYANQTFESTNLIGEASEGDNAIRFALYSVYENNVQKIKAGFYTVNTGWIQAISSTNLSLKKWTHIAATYDQSSIKIYVDGTQTANASFSNALPAGNERWLIGKNWTSPNYFPGTIDEIRIWNTARSQADIQANKNNIISTSSAGLVGYYQLDESSGSNASDATGHGYTGTVN
jgi:hypothetical protein